VLLAFVVITTLPILFEVVRGKLADRRAAAAPAGTDEPPAE